MASGSGIKFIIKLGLGLWDVCCGHALCKEVGGNLVYLNGEELIYSDDPNKRHLTKFSIFAPNAEKLKKFVEVYAKSGIDADKQEKTSIPLN